MTLDPVRRSYSKRKPASRLDRIDADVKARWLQAAGWTVLVGAVLGLLASMAPGGRIPLPAGIFGGALLGLLAAFVVVAVTGGIGDTVGLLFHPPSRRGGRPTDYSRARSLAARGDIAAAVAEYEAHIAAAPRVADAYLALARLLEEEKGDFEGAARALRRGRRDADLVEGQRILVGRRLVEIYTHRLGEPRRALPELARLAEGFQDRAEGERAARELAELRRELAGPER